MSWYETVVLSFRCDEFEDEEDESNQDCEPLRKINSWLKRRRFEPLTNLNSYENGVLGSNAVLFGGCYNYLDVEEFYDCVQRQKWNAIEDVQLIHWDDNASKFDLFQFQTLKRSRAKVGHDAKAQKRRTNNRQHGRIRSNSKARRRTRHAE